MHHFDFYPNWRTRFRLRGDGVIDREADRQEGRKTSVIEEIASNILQESSLYCFYQHSERHSQMVSRVPIKCADVCPPRD